MDILFCTSLHYYDDDNNLIWMMYIDVGADEFSIGIACWVICGDADGDGNPGQTSSALSGLGGNDFPNMAQSESFLVAFDFGGPNQAPADGALDFILGYPAG